MSNMQAIPTMKKEDIYSILNQVVDRVQLTGAEFKQVSTAMANLSVILSSGEGFQDAAPHELQQTKAPKGPRKKPGLAES